MFYFHKVVYVHYLGEVEIFSYMSKQIYSSLQQCKKYKNRSRFPKVMITNVLPPFLWFTVYISRSVSLFSVTVAQSVNRCLCVNQTSVCVCLHQERDFRFPFCYGNPVEWELQHGNGGNGKTQSKTCSGWPQRCALVVWRADRAWNCAINYAIHVVYD